MDQVVWPVKVEAIGDPDFTYEAHNAQDLGQYVEYWNADSMSSEDDLVVLTDALGRKLGGKIDKLQVVELFLLDENR